MFSIRSGKRPQRVRYGSADCRAEFLYHSNINLLASLTRLCDKRLVLLCHKLALWQQGHRGSRRAILRANLMRMLVMDDLTWRSARIGGSAGSKTVG